MPACIYTCLHTDKYTCIKHICMHAFINIYTQTHGCVYIYTHTYIYIHVNTHVYALACLATYIHT